MSEWDSSEIQDINYPLISKNGFDFRGVNKYQFFPNCLLYYELPLQQTTAEFSGSWTVENRVYNKFKVEFTIFVDTRSAHWIGFGDFKYYYIADDYVKVGSKSVLSSSTQDDYALIKAFNIDDAFDLSQLTLTSPDRLDAKGTYYINWKTYYFQNNGEQLLKDAIKPEFADKKDYIMQTYGLLLRGLRTLGIDEWLPYYYRKINIEIHDLNKTPFIWYPLRIGEARLNNYSAHLEYLIMYYDGDSGLVVLPTDNYELRFTYYVKEVYYTKEDAIPYIEEFTVQNWSTDTQIQVYNSDLSVSSKTVSTIQGPDAIWKKIQFITNKNIWEQLKCNYPRFGFFNLKSNKPNKYNFYIDYIYNTDDDKFRTEFEYVTEPNEPHYYITINKQRNYKIEVGSTKIYDVSFLLPSDAYALNDVELSPLEVKDLNVKVVNDDNNSFTASLTDINISEYARYYETDINGNVKFVIGNLGTAKLNVTCNNKDFSASTRIEVSLNPRWEFNLSDERIPVDYLSFGPEQAPEFVIPEGTVLNIYNNKCDRLTFQTQGFSLVDEAEFNITFESPDEAEFKKRKIEFDFQKDGTAFNLIFKDNVDDRSKRVFYNFTDKVFTGTIKFTWKVNGEVFTNVHEIPVLYHNERYTPSSNPNPIWDPNGSEPNELHIPYESEKNGYAKQYNYFYGYGNIFNDGFKSAADYGCHVISSNSNIFEKAEFGIYREIGYLTLSNIKENQYTNPRQARINIYLQYQDDVGKLKYIDDPEMWPSTYIDVIQDGTGLADPVIEDDSLYGANDDQNILRLNNMVSTPITQNNYSVNMQTKEQPQLTISDDLYFLDSSPVYVDGNQKQVILKYYTTLTGTPSVTFTNTEGFLPGINSVQVDAQQKAVTVNMNYNKGQTTQGYVTLTIGTRSVSMGVFQNKAEQYFDLKLTSYSITYSPITFGIKYTTKNLTPSDIHVRHLSGEKIMQTYSVESQSIFIVTNGNPMITARTEIIEIYTNDSGGNTAFAQEVSIRQSGSSYPESLNFNIEPQDGDYAVFSGQAKILTGKISRYDGSIPTGYKIKPVPVNTNDYTVQCVQTSGESYSPVFQLVINNKSAIIKDITVPVDFQLVYGTNEILYSTKTLVFTLGQSNGILLQPNELIFDYRGVAKDNVNYITVKKSGGVSNLTITSSLDKLPFTVRVSGNYIYITDLETRISSSSNSWLVHARADSQDFSFVVTQTASPHTYEYPIWKDIYVDLPYEHNHFRLVNISSGFIMYEGMIYGVITSQVGITDVLRDYMTTVSDPFVNTFTSTQYLLVDMQTSQDGVNWQSSYTFRLYYNYSYDEERKVYLEAQPIDYFDPRQYLLFTFQSYDNIKENIEITKKFGTTSSQTQSFSSYNEQKTYVSKAASNYSIKIKTSNEEKIFKDRCTNTNYAVYYINRYGGWSWMLFQGKNLKTDKTKQSTYMMDFDNNVGTEFNTKVYQNDITETWQLTSDYLTDKQSELLKHLYSSPLVYLHDLKEDKVMSVLVDTKSFDYKTYRNQGRKMFTHTIKVNSSQTKIIL